MKIAQRVSLRQLRLFIAVAETGSFTAAAKLMHVTQPAVSMQVHELESMIGEVLLDGRRGFRLTSAGEILLRHAREVIASLELAEVELKAMKGVASGTVSVGAVTTAEYFVPRLLAAFGEAYPDIRFRLTVRNRSGMADLLRERGVDVAIMGAPPAGLALRRVPFAPDPMSFVVPPSHPLAGRKSVPPSALAGERLLLREQGSGTRAAMERFLRAHGVKLTQADEMGSNETLKQAAMAGLGVSFLSHHTFSIEAAAGRLSRLKVRGTPIEREWNLLVPADKRPSLAVEALVDFLQNQGRALMEETGD
ncbi:MAG TPA: LysR family transcriptional regulator [Azoarcus taiwanensis]|nr:LysR family transcriptional regulator [Azoarcus taiwanensis]